VAFPTDHFDMLEYKAELKNTLSASRILSSH